MSNHSENIKKATDKKSQIINTNAVKNEKALEGQSIEM